MLDFPPWHAFSIICVEHIGLSTFQRNVITFISEAFSSIKFCSSFMLSPFLLECHSPIGIISFGSAAKPAADTHAGETRLHNVGIVGRAALPSGANSAGGTQRTGGADLTAGRHAAVVKGTARHKTLASGIGSSASNRCPSSAVPDHRRHAWR